MNSIDQIVAQLESNLGTVEAKRVHAMEQRSQFYNLLLGVGGGGLLLCLLLVPVFTPLVFVPGVIVILIVAAVMWAKNVGPAAREFRAEFKTAVVGELVQALQPKLRYLPHQGISEGLFRSTQLFATRADRYHTEDQLAGKIGETDVLIAEVHAEEKRTRRDSDGDTETYYVTIFDGVMMVADFHKSFSGITRVLPDNESGVMAGLGKAVKGFFPFGSKELIRMEDPEFENHFAVYTTDPVEARYLLSTAMMQRLLDLRRVWKGAAIRLSFVDSMVNLAIPTNQNLFEPKLQHSLLGNAELYRVVEELSSCFELVEQLNLDTRIWSRE